MTILRSLIQSPEERYSARRLLELFENDTLDLSTLQLNTSKYIFDLYFKIYLLYLIYFIFLKYLKFLKIGKKKT